MNRRRFLSLLGLAAAGAALPSIELDPERALWVPGSKSIFDLGASDPDFGDWDDDEDWDPEDEIGPGGGGNVFVTAPWLAAEALKVLQNNLAFTKQINRQYGERFGAAIGETVNVRRLARFDFESPESGRQVEQMERQALRIGQPTVVLRPGEEFITIERKS